MDNKIEIELDLEQELIDELNNLAILYDITISEVVEKALTSYLESV